MLELHKENYHDEEVCRKHYQNKLNSLMLSLEEKKKILENLRVVKPHKSAKKIPAEFLASQKLMMNKRKFSPSKLKKSTNLTPKRSISASK